MGVKSRSWMGKHRKELEEKYPGKVLIVCEDKVEKVLDANVGVLEINDIAEKLCQGRDWSYTFMCKEEECVL